MRAFFIKIAAGSEAVERGIQMTTPSSVGMTSDEAFFARLARLNHPKGGVILLGLAAIMYGIACFLQRDFAIYWQPAPQDMPFRLPLAYLSAGLLVVGGAGLLITRTVRAAAMLLLLLFLLYDAGYLWVLIHEGLEKSLLGLAEQSSVVIGSWAILLRTRAGGSAATAAARIGFGICSIIFALAHFIGFKITASMVPTWMPGGQLFWAIATGVGHLAVGLALIGNRLAIPATRLGALMYSAFALLTWMVPAFMHPTEWLRWAGVAISLCMAGALLLVGDLLAARREDE